VYAVLRPPGYACPDLFLEMSEPRLRKFLPYVGFASQCDLPPDQIESGPRLRSPDLVRSVGCIHESGVVCDQKDVGIHTLTQSP
jgi:hypothetical protein